MRYVLVPPEMCAVLIKGKSSAPWEAPLRRGFLLCAQYLESFLPIDSKTNYVLLVDQCASPSARRPNLAAQSLLQGPENSQDHCPAPAGLSFVI